MLKAEVFTKIDLADSIFPLKNLARLDLKFVQ